MTGRRGEVQKVKDDVFKSNKVSFIKNNVFSCIFIILEINKKLLNNKYNYFYCFKFIYLLFVFINKLFFIKNY